MPWSQDHGHDAGGIDTIRSRPLPYPEADLMHVWQLLEEPERKRLEGIRAFLQNRVRPESIGYWNREEFPHHLLPEMAAFGLGGIQADGSSDLFKGLVYVEAARADVSLSALVGIHNELIVGMIHEFGSATQKARWLPRLTNFTALGAFALTVPECVQVLAWPVNRGISVTIPSIPAVPKSSISRSRNSPARIFEGACRLCRGRPKRWGITRPPACPGQNRS